MDKTMIDDIFKQLIPYLPVFLGCCWVLAIAIYSLKFVWPWWDDFTRFGKLEKKTNLRILTIPNELGWCAFYIFSCVMFIVGVLVTGQVTAPSFLLMVHSARRFIECVTITNFSERRMHIINFGAGMFFYFITPVTLLYSAIGQSGRAMTSSVVVIALFLNVLQFLVHKELASLKKYSIPTGPLFTYLTSPHYTLEVGLYLCYFALAPNILTFLMFVFVFLNLAHQATMTYRWYVTKFAGEFVRRRRRVLIPVFY